MHAQVADGRQLPGVRVEQIQQAGQHTKRRAGVVHPQRKQPETGHQLGQVPEIVGQHDGLQEAGHRRLRIDIGEHRGELDQRLRVIGYRTQEPVEQTELGFGFPAPPRRGHRLPDSAVHPRLTQLRQVHDQPGDLLRRVPPVLEQQGSPQPERAELP